MDKQIKVKLVEAAILAPSGDNCQPLSFQWHGDLLRLVHVHERGVAKINTANIATYLYVGAVLVNLELVAESSGFSLSWNKKERRGNEEFVIEVHFSPQQPNHSNLLEAIADRHVNRNPYLKSKIPDDAQIALDLLKSEFADISYSLTDDKQKIKRLARVLSHFDSMIIENFDVHSYLFKWLRWNAEEIEATGDGMPIASLEMNLLERILFRFLRHWSVAKMLARLNIGAASCSRAFALYRQSSVIGAISTNSIDTDKFIRAGQLFQKSWLIAEKFGVSFQPIAGVPLTVTRLMSEGLGDLTSKQQQLFARAREEITEILPHLKHEYPLICFRLGVAKRSASARTKRLPLEKIVTYEES